MWNIIFGKINQQLIVSLEGDGKYGTIIPDDYERIPKMMEHQDSGTGLH